MVLIPMERNTAVITGVGRGIGKALAEKFLFEGWTVVGTTTDGTCSFTHERLAIVSLDLGSVDSIASCAEDISRLTKSIDILVNNAGVLLDEEEVVVVPQKLRKTLEINLVGTIDFTEHLLPLLSPQAHIIQISSTAGSIEGAGKVFSHHPGHYPSYRISKAALNMYTKILALRLAPAGGIVSSVHPGWVRTDMGGMSAPRLPEEAAVQLYSFAVSKPETGGFWFDGKRVPW